MPLGSILRRMHGTMLFALVSALAVAVTVQADELVMSDGRVVSGLILSSTVDSVTIRAGGPLQEFPKAEVATYRFGASDIILSKDNERSDVKVLRKDGEHVFVLTAAGVQTWSNGDIKKVWYCRGPQLESSQMGATGHAFVNRPTSGVSLGDPRRTFAIGARIGSHFPLLEDWKRQFDFGDNKITLPSAIVLGGDLSFDVSKSMYVGGGFEYLWGRGVKLANLEGNPTDRPTAWHVFGTAGFGLSPRSNPDVSMGGALDLGYLWARETVSASGVSVQGKAETFAVRPKFRISLEADRGLRVFGDFGILFANARDVTGLGQTFYGYDLDFSGLSIICGVAYVGIM